MICLENINIAFDRILFKDASIHLASGKINVIKGESGSGKSSLLYLIGLMKCDKNVKYTFHHHVIDMTNDNEMANIRKNKIGYVFQENSLIDHLSIYENLKFYADLSDSYLDEEKAKSVLSNIYLAKDLHQTIKTLSGGEKQRLAIACALVKNPELLILDEPTSALDEKNAQMIMSILRYIASKGVTVLLTSHDDFIVSQCDIVYTFKNYKIVADEVSLDGKVFKEKKVKLPFKFFVCYAIEYMKANLFSFIALISVLGLVISLLMGYQKIGNAFAQLQLDSLNDIANCEILVTSEQNEQGEAYYHEGLSDISKVQLDNIKNIENCVEVYPFSQGVSTYVSIMDETKELYCVIQPYTPRKDLSVIADILYESKDGIYISNALFREFNLSNVDTIDISFDIYFGMEYITEIKEVEIAGVMPSNYRNHYADSDHIIYVPYELMPKQESVCALLVYADHYQNINKVKEELMKINMDFGVFNDVFRIAYLDEVLKSIEMVTPFLMSVLMLITIAMIIIVYTRYINNRKIEMCLLEVNGLSKYELTKLLMVELGLQVSFIAIISIVMLRGLVTLVNTITPFVLEMNVLDALKYSLGYAFLFILPPTLISLWIFERQDPTTILRN